MDGVRPVSTRKRYAPPTDARELFAHEALGALTAVEAENAPRTLFVAGDVELLRSGLRVSIVGSRKASEAGQRRASRLARELALAGVTVVSGLAKGIDQAAHLGAISNGGRTVAVIGTPLERAYPADHAALQERIYREHLLVSQFSPRQRVFPSSFVKRNRTMALLSHASVIVEAADGSGSLSQASETQRLGRPLFLMESVVENRALQWPDRFLDAGATILSSTGQILESFGRLV